MKNIFYCSNAQSDIFPHNTRSKFNNYIDINHLNYLPTSNIEAAIKSITFDAKRDDKLLKDHVLAIRSNICEYAIRNGEYDQIISLINASKLATDVVHVDFKNPTFFSTKKELLSRAHFEVIDLETNSAPNFSTGSPTYIQVVIRKITPRMKKPFNIFLDSSCPKSKEHYPKNTHTEFTVELPERMDFRRNWHVALKSLFIPNKFANVDDCYISYFYYNWSLFNDKQDTVLKLLPKHCSTIESVLHQLNFTLKVWDIKIRAEMKDGKVAMVFFEGWREWPYSNTLTLSPNLAHILGFKIYDPNKKNEVFEVEFNKTETQFASSEPDLFFFVPRNLIVCCDIVDDTIFGGEHVKLLRLVTNSINTKLDILSFDFLQNEYIELGVKEFKSIKIRIADVSGKNVKCDSDIPTRLQLMFVNV
jgi:hypothetical protein